jgi:hypothetical protein
MKTSQFLLVVVIVLAVSVAPLHAQRQGSRTSGFQQVVPPGATPVQPFTQSPVQPFMQSPVQPFGVAPAAIPAPSAAPKSNFFLNPHRFGGRNDITVIAPGGTVILPSNGLIAPGAGFVPGFAAPAFVPGFNSGGVIVQTGPSPVERGVTHERTAPAHLPPAGTTREQVIQQFGNPAASVITRDGETLVFNGGLTIFLQNGQVAGAK